MKHRCLVPCLLFMLMVGMAGAHPSDVSQMRVKLRHEAVEFRLSLNLLTLSRIVIVDADHNQRITPQEIAQAVPTAAAWLKKKVLVSVNETESDLGDFKGHDNVWPNSATEEVTDQEASQRYVDFNFVRPWPAGVLEVWTGFQIFAQVGDQHTVQTIYQQQGQPDQPVDFTQQEPEYLYDTGWDAAVTIKPAKAAKPWSWRWAGTIGLVIGGGFLAWGRRRRREKVIS